MAILKATFTAFVDQGLTGDSFPVNVEWTSTTALGQVQYITVNGGAGTPLTIPPGTAPALIVLIPPTTNAVTYSINGVGAGPIMPATGAVVIRAPAAATLVSTGVNITPFTVIYL